MATRRHSGPLRVQKALYPEGTACCHAIVLHPPGGIAGGDQLAIDIAVGSGASALITTPGAGKWYRSGGAEASQQVRVSLADGAALEWLPQENIVFNGANARIAAQVDLADGARFLGLDVLCLGRRASGETFASGTLRLAADIHSGGRLLWRERGHLDGGSALLHSPAGLAGHSVCATWQAAGLDADAQLLSACRAATPAEAAAQWGITAMPGLMVGRYLGHSAEAARQWFVEVWHVLRPALLGRAAVVPRIWNT